MMSRAGIIVMYSYDMRPGEAGGGRSTKKYSFSVSIVYS